ncbi:MAG: hypothetical protein GC155_13735 [Alphaproteobacteria bacterium]|nr:hypothetical protein [Alphaproteobacteria bacterium]
MRTADRLKAMKAAAPATAATLAVVGALVIGSVIAPRPTPPGALPVAVAPVPDVETPLADAPQDTPKATPPGPGSAIPGVQFDQSPGAALPGQDMEIVVKFKDDAKVKDIVDTFWKDAGAARAKFNAFKRNRPEMSDVTLDRVTYSNELVLVHAGGGSAAQRLAAMRDIAKRLAAAPDVSYAEPNMTAQPGGH